MLELFHVYHWPGNIRQLANVLRTAAVMSAGEHLITTAHLSDDFLEDARRAGTTARAPAPPTTLPVQTVAVEALPPGPPAIESTAPRPAPVAGMPPHTLEEAEIEMIRAAVEAAGGNISAASKQLGISRNTIYRKLRWNLVGKAT